MQAVAKQRAAVKQAAEYEAVRAATAAVMAQEATKAAAAEAAAAARAQPAAREVVECALSFATPLGVKLLGNTSSDASPSSEVKRAALAFDSLRGQSAAVKECFASPVKPNVTIVVRTPEPKQRAHTEIGEHEDLTTNLETVGMARPREEADATNSAAAAIKRPRGLQAKLAPMRNSGQGVAVASGHFPLPVTFVGHVATFLFGAHTSRHLDGQLVLELLGQLLDAATGAASTCFTARVCAISAAQLAALVGTNVGRLDFEAAFSRADLGYVQGDVLYVDGTTITRPQFLEPFVPYTPTYTTAAAFYSGQDVSALIGLIPHRHFGRIEYAVGPTAPRNIRGNTWLYTDLQPACAVSRAAIANAPYQMPVNLWFNRHAGYNRHTGNIIRFVATDAFACVQCVGNNVVVVTLKFWPGFGDIVAYWS